MKSNLFRATALLLCLLTITGLTSIQAGQTATKSETQYGPVAITANNNAATPVNAAVNILEWTKTNVNAKVTPFTIYVKMDYADSGGFVMVTLRFYSDEEATIPVEVSSLTVNYTHTEYHPFFGGHDYNWDAVCDGYSEELMGGPYQHFEPLPYPNDNLMIERRTCLRAGAYVPLLTDPFYS